MNKGLFGCKMLVLLTVIAFCMSACAQSKGTMFTIHGNKTPYDKVIVVNYNKNMVVDTVQVVNGEFTFVTNKEGENVFYGIYGLRQNSGVDVVSDGEIVEVDMSTQKATGTPLNDKLSAMNDKINLVIDKYTQINKQYSATQNETEKAELRKKMSNMAKDVTDIVVKTIDENQDNCLPALLLAKTCTGIEFAKLDGYASKKTAYSEHPLFKQVLLYVEYMRPSMAFIGQKFTDVTGKDFEGKSHKLSEYVGKGNYVLVDFWASWCGPCMHEMPTVKACWEKYKSKGFEVVGISLDNDATKWRNAVQTGGYNWPHISDLGGWKSEAAKAYNVQSIPWNFLCDGEGKIIAVSLRGSDLEGKLAEIYD